MTIELSIFKLALIAFWGLWFLIVFLSNLCAALKALGAISAKSRLASQNYDLVVKATARYKAPPWLPNLLFCGVLLWQLLAFVLLACALVDSVQAHAIAIDAVNTAFAAGCMLWAAFMLADEIFMEYNNERAHILLFMAQLGSLAAIHLLQ